jgi:hypothetical protein
VLKAGKAHAPALLEVVVEIAMEAPAERARQAEQAAIGTVLQQDPVEVVVELDAAGHASPCLFQPVDDVGQTVDPLDSRLGRLVERKRLQGGEDRPDLPNFGRIQRGQAKSPAGVRHQEAFPREPEQCFADGSTTDAQLRGDGGVAELGSSGYGSLLKAMQNLEIDLLTERSARDSG